MKRPLALLAAGAVALAGCGGGDDGGSGGGTTTKPNTTAIELPATLGTYKDLTDVTKSKAPSGDAATQLQARQANTAKLTTAAYTEAFGGAASAFRSYADAGLEQLPSVVAVRADAPGITFGPVVDPKDLRLAKAPNEVVKLGAVECLVAWDPVVEGQTPDPGQEHVRHCQRVGDGRTVFVYGSGFEGSSGVTAMAKLAEDAWNATGSAG